MNRHILSLLFFFGLTALLTLSPAYAEQSEVLSPEELAQCLQRESNLEAIAEQLNTRSAEVQMLNDKLQQLEQQRNREYADIDFHNEASVNAYNQLNQQIKQASELYLNEAEEFNRAVRQYKADVVELESECDQKKYYKKTP